MMEVMTVLCVVALKRAVLRGSEESHNIQVLYHENDVSSYCSIVVALCLSLQE